EPFPNIPDVPTFESLGFELYASIDRGAGAPPDTPDEIIQVLEKAFLDIANSPEVKAQMKKDGFVPIALGAAESKAYIAGKVTEWAPVVKEFKK
ncbi:MAG: tripartite tricarboxylate transporter substrate-binding protein, partial [Desulfobacterales bacterium]